MLGDGIAFPVAIVRGSLVARTCMTRGTLPQELRAARNRRKQSRRFRHRADHPNAPFGQHRRPQFAAREDYDTGEGIGFAKAA